MSDKWQNYDAEEWNEQDKPTFERLRKQTDKPQTLKNDRRQQAKEWGKAVNKYHKQRRRAGEYNKP
jgi:hypothetical protein